MNMTQEDVMKWCDRGNHDFLVVDVAEGIKDDGHHYLILKCTKCPARKVNDL